jgi:hypothetical protein
MIQLFFLSILFNGLTGYVLVSQDKWENDTIENSLKLSPRSETFRLVLGILTAVTGFLKLLSPVMESTPVLGDMVPAVLGIIGGFILAFAYYRDHAQAMDTEGNFDRIGNAFLRGKKIAGYALLASAILHFLFPQALLL